MVLNIFTRNCIFHDLFQHPLMDYIFIEPVGPIHMWLYVFLVCPTILPYICIICYNFEVFLYTIFHFLWYFTHGISETQIPLVFIFSWLWPQLYYLFHVFSIVNIYKTLNKLFKIAFYNLPFHASKMRGTEKSHSDLPCVTECMNSLSKEDQGPLVSSSFFFFFLFFSYLNFPAVFWVWRLTRWCLAKSRDSWPNSLSLTSPLAHIPSLCSGLPFPSTPQWMLKNISFEELVHNIKKALKSQ